MDIAQEVLKSLQRYTLIDVCHFILDLLLATKSIVNCLVFYSVQINPLLRGCVYVCVQISIICSLRNTVQDGVIKM